MMNLRKALTAALSGVFLASALSWVAPVAPVRAAPGDVNVGLAMVIEGQGNGHGRGLSQYGAVGWSTIYGKDWTGFSTTITAAPRWVLFLPELE